MGPYRTIFTGTLVQDSAFSAGGNQPHAAVDDPICKDGLDRFIIRGTTLAGALLTTAAKIFGTVSDSISGKYYEKRDDATKAQNQERKESLWRLFNAHPQVSDGRGTPSDLRQGVKILAETGAAEDEALFDMETLPRGTRWDFCMEVNIFGDSEETLSGVPSAESVAFAALKEWERGNLWLGRSVARGMGWMHLDNLRVYQLTTEHVDLWPDSSKEPDKALAALQHTEIPLDRFMADETHLTHNGSWYYVQIPCSIRLGDRGSECYGLDALAVGGHSASSLALTWRKNHYLPIPGIKSGHPGKEFKPDLGMAMTPPADNVGTLAQDGLWEPFVPGSSIRGTLRQALSRILSMEARTAGEAAEDSPGAGAKEGCDGYAEIQKLFGTIEESSALLVQDAYIRNGQCTAVWLHHHAEDEFSGGVYGSSKFDRVALVQGEFHFKIVIEASAEGEAIEQFRCLDKALSLARQGRLPLGGGQWRGLGWPQWNIGPAILRRAGSSGELRRLEIEQ